VTRQYENINFVTSFIESKNIKNPSVKIIMVKKKEKKSNMKRKTNIFFSRDSKLTEKQNLSETFLMSIVWVALAIKGALVLD
jgi:hypothetical protein